MSCDTLHHRIHWKVRTINFGFTINFLAVGLIFFISGISGTEAAISFRAATSVNKQTSGSSCTISKPTGTIKDDVMIAAFQFDRGSSVTPPTGWTVIVRTNDAIHSMSVISYYKVAGASEPASYTWTLAPASGWCTGGMQSYVGASTSTPLDVFSGQSGTSNSPTTPSLTTTADSNWLIGVWAVWNSNVTINLPAGMTSRINFTGASPHRHADQSLGAAGTTGTRVTTTSTTAGSWIAQAITMKSAAAAPDTTPPVISSITTTAITATSATMTWTTNELADSQVEYGLTTNYGSSTPLDTTLVTAHAQTLSGLASSTLYHYRVKSRDAAGNLVMSGDNTFLTAASTDTTPPTVALTSPAANTTVSGTITVSATASDNIGVVGVQFLVDGAALGAEDTSAPFAIAWNSTTAANGSHTLSAVARDAAGNIATSTSITVTVNNPVADTTPPVVSMSAPANGATVSGTAVTVSANASDNVGVVGVQFKLDGNNLGAEDTSAPFTIVWNSTTAANGAHTLSAVARDAAGNIATAPNINVTVSNSSGIPLTIDGAQRFQTMDGFGVSLNVHSWNNGELQPALDLLVTQLRPTLWRVIMEMEDWEATNDNSDPNVFDWTYYNSVYTSPKFEDLWSTMSYLNQRGIVSGIILDFMGPVSTWMGGSHINTASEDEWVEMIASLVYYARITRNLQFDMLSPLNEPDWDGFEGPQVDQWQYVRLMQKLVQELDSLGLSSIRLVGPDTAAIGTGVNSYMPEMMNNPTIMAKLDHFAFHNYAGSTGGAEQAIQSSLYPNKNFWMTEVSNIWDAFPEIEQGAAATIVWDAYDSVYNHAILAGRGSNPPNDAGNGPALLAYNTSNHTYTPRRAFYEHAQLFKYVEPGAQRIGAVETNNNLTVLAFRHPTTNHITIVGRNTGSSNMTIAGNLINLPNVSLFAFYQTTSSLNMQRGTDVAVNNGTFTVTVAGNSVFTLTSP